MLQKETSLEYILINVEAFATKKIKPFLESFTHRSEFLLAIDESTTIKNVKAKRTKAIVEFGRMQSIKEY